MLRYNTCRRQGGAQRDRNCNREKLRQQCCLLTAHACENSKHRRKGTNTYVHVQTHICQYTHSPTPSYTIPHYHPHTPPLPVTHSSTTIYILPHSLPHSPTPCHTPPLPSTHSPTPCHTLPHSQPHTPPLPVIHPITTINTLPHSQSHKVFRFFTHIMHSGHDYALIPGKEIW